MKKLTIFYLETCPYCENARKALEELREENPAYGDIRIDWIEESRRPELAEEYDYYYVPTIFDGGTKLYEASPMHNFQVIKKHIRTALDAAAE